MRHRNSPSLPAGAIPTTSATKRNVEAMVRQAAVREQQQRARRVKALLRVADQLQRHHPDAAALARSWAGDAA